MADKYNNKYRNESARCSNWDYGSNAAYFVTICTANRECFFGEIINNQMILSEIGQLASKYWLEIPDHFSFIDLDEYTVMPNHIHGIIIINKPDDIECRDAINRVPTFNINPIHQNNNPGGITGKKNPMLNNNLSRVIRWYKGRTSFESRKLNPDFSWQSRFHDHIIRDEKSYQKIKFYIRNNSKNWSNDELIK